MINIRFAIAATAASFVLGQGVAQERWEIPNYQVFGEAANPQDAKAIDEVLSAFQAAWVEQDAERVAQLHSDDVEWINAYARMFRSADALETFLDERLFPAFPISASESEISNMKPISRRYIGQDAAILHLYTDGSRGDSVNQGDGLRRTHFHFALEKRDCEWSIAHVAIMDARR